MQKRLYNNVLFGIINAKNDEILVFGTTIIKREMI